MVKPLLVAPPLATRTPRSTTERDRLLRPVVPPRPTTPLPRASAPGGTLAYTLLGAQVVK